MLRGFNAVLSTAIVLEAMILAFLLKLHYPGHSDYWFWGHMWPCMLGVIVLFIVGFAITFDLEERPDKVPDNLFVVMYVNKLLGVLGVAAWIAWEVYGWVF